MTLLGGELLFSSLRTFKGGASVIKNGEWYLEGPPFSITQALVPRVELNEISKLS